MAEAKPMTVSRRATPCAALAALAAMLVAPGAAALAQEGYGTPEERCFEYGAPTEISGFYLSGTVPGAPEFADAQSGDEALTAHFLLTAPFCMAAGDDDSAPQAIDVEIVQLACDADTIEALADRPGAPATLRGELFARHTSYHWTAVLLDCGD